MDVVGARVCGCGSGMCLMPKCGPWQLDMIGTHEFGDGIWIWFVPACVAVAFGCDW